MTKTTKNWLYAIFLIIAVLFPQIGKAQIFESKTGVDTLTFAERISLRTNAVDWTLLTPNLGVEFDVKSESGKTKCARFEKRNVQKSGKTKRSKNFAHTTL